MAQQHKLLTMASVVAISGGKRKGKIGRDALSILLQCPGRCQKELWPLSGVDTCVSLSEPHAELGKQYAVLCHDLFFDLFHSVLFRHCPSLSYVPY